VNLRSKWCSSRVGLPRGYVAYQIGRCCVIYRSKSSTRLTFTSCLVTRSTITLPLKLIVQHNPVYLVCGWFFNHNCKYTASNYWPSTIHLVYQRATITFSMSSPKLPSELTDDIIDHICDDMHALAKCSTVCKSWLTRSRHHHFRHIS